MYESITSQVSKLDSHLEIHRIKPIGSGRFGKVYQGYDKTNGKMVALKYISNNKEQTWRKEVKALQQLSHPNIIKYYCVVTQKIPKTDIITGVYIVTQFVRGKTLNEYISSIEKVGERGLPQSIVLHLFAQLIDGYQYMHRQKFVHRDIKPENILIDENQNVKIIDFGQSKERVLLKTNGLGTPLYSAPENYSGENIADFRGDVWSLGLVLYEMITGRCYFQQWKQCNDKELFISHLLSHKVKIKYPDHFNPFWYEITLKMLKKNYKQRAYLHEIAFQLQQRLPQLESKLKQKRQLQPIIDYKLIESASSGNTNPLTQTQNEFEYSRTKKYLRYFNQKHKFLIMLGQLFSKYRYPFLSNSHKLILTFLSLCIYTSAVDHLLKRLSSQRIKITDNQIFDITYFQQPYRSSMKQYLHTYREFYQRQSRLTKDKLLESIIPRLTKKQQSCPQSQSSHTHSQSHSQSLSQSSSTTCSISPLQLLQYEQFSQIKTLINTFKLGTIFDKGYLVRIFRDIVYGEQCYHYMHNVRKYFYQQDLLVYYLMLILANLDTVFNWGFDYCGNQMLKLREELGSLKRSPAQIQLLIDKIQKYNKK